MKTLVNKTLLFSLLMLPMLAFALANDELRGTVVNTNKDTQMITLKVLETGKNSGFRKDTVKVFYVPESTSVQGYLNTSIQAALGTIGEQDIIRVKFDLEKPNQLKLISRER